MKSIAREIGVFSTFLAAAAGLGAYFLISGASPHLSLGIPLAIVSFSFGVAGLGGVITRADAFVVDAMATSIVLALVWTVFALATRPLWLATPISFGVYVIPFFIFWRGRQALQH